MTKIKQLASIGYKIHKGRLYLGKPQEPKDGEFYFYFECPTGKLIQPHTDIFYVSEDKIPCTLTEIIKELYSPSEEELCMFFHNYDLRTQDYFNEISKNIGLEEVYSSIPDEIKNIEKQQFPTKFVNGSADICQKDNNYFILIYHSFMDDEFVDVFKFLRYPNADAVHTAYNIKWLKSQFLSKTFKVNFKCRECGQVHHWLDGEGDLDSAINRLEDRWCGMC